MVNMQISELPPKSDISRPDCEHVKPDFCSSITHEDLLITLFKHQACSSCC